MFASTWRGEGTSERTVQGSDGVAPSESTGTAKGGSDLSRKRHALRLGRQPGVRACACGRTGSFDRRTGAGYVSQRKGDYARAQAAGLEGVPLSWRIVACVQYFPPAETSRKVLQRKL